MCRRIWQQLFAILEMFLWQGWRRGPSNHRGAWQGVHVCGERVHQARAVVVASTVGCVRVSKYVPRGEVGLEVVALCMVLEKVCEGM